MSTLTYGGLSVAKRKPAGIGEKWREFVGFAWACHRRYSQRRQLSHLSDRMLKDIGISRVDALCEAEKHFWQA